MKILIVEDDVALAKFLGRELSSRNFSVDLSHDGQAAYEHLQHSSYDLAILDLNLPKMDGMELLKHVRRIHPNMPILILTARNRTEDLVCALECGADDCLIKPFSFLELTARIGSLLRRKSAAVSTAQRIHDLVVNKDEHKVMRGERKIDLTPREFAILDYLMDNVGKPVSRALLMRDVWNVPFDPGTNIVDVYMKYLRDKVDRAGETKLIRTVRGVGYVLSCD